MNGGKRRIVAGKGSFGYTIIEVMIVLAVSGVMFLIAGTFVSGKQGRTAFTEGVNELASTLQDTIEGVTDGQYTDIKVNCNFTGATTTFPPGANGQGTNSSCVFLGKVLHFRENDGHGNPTTQQYEILSLAGGRIGTDKKPITVLANAKPAVIPTLTAHATIPQRLSVKRVKVNGGTLPDSYGVAFLQGLGSAEVTGGGAPTGDVAMGAQSVGLWYVNGLVQDKNTTDVSALIAAGSLTAAKQIDLCVTDDTRYATITLGTNGNQLSVNVSMHGEEDIC